MLVSTMYIIIIEKRKKQIFYSVSQKRVSCLNCEVDFLAYG